ncbi:MAG: hypothetical protein FWF83_08620 [Clostridiales bacterium]|nr:hypothetical protein [Clostridiales bacterium]
MSFLLLCLCAFFLFAGLIVTMLLYPFEPPLPYGIGLIAGTALNLLKVRMMESSLNRTADMGDSRQAKNYGAMQAMVRNLMTLALFALVFFFRDIFGLFGTVIGVLYMQIAAYAAGYLIRKDRIKV